MLARIEGIEGVLDAWTDKAGAKIVVSFKEEVSSSKVVALISSELAPRTVTEIAGSEASEAIRACNSGAPGWFRAKETIALSQEEAGILAGRVARKAAEDAGLEPDQRDAFEKLTSEALVRVFKEQHHRDSFNAGALNARIKAELAKVVDGLDLAPEPRRRLVEALEAEWSRSRSRATTEGTGR